MLLWPKSEIALPPLSPHKSLFSDSLCNILSQRILHGSLSLVTGLQHWPLIGLWRLGPSHYAIQSPTTLNIWTQTPLCRASRNQCMLPSWCSQKMNFMGLTLKDEHTLKWERNAMLFCSKLMSWHPVFIPGCTLYPWTRPKSAHLSICPLIGSQYCTMQCLDA